MRFRVLTALGVALAGTCAVVVVAVAGGQLTGSERLPDLRQEPPAGFLIHRQRGRVVLAFRSAVGNVGRGALIVNGTRTRGQRLMTVTQELTREDGTRVQVPIRARMTYTPTGHNHWHLQRFDLFELRDPVSGRLVARSAKVGFCLGSRYPVSPAVPDAPGVPRINHNCGRHLPGLMRMREGIEVGFADDYVALVEGQYIDITTVRPGRYVVVHRADPDRPRVVGDRTDDVASALVALAAPARAGGLPRFTLIAQCSETAGGPGTLCGTA